MAKRISAHEDSKLTAEISVYCDPVLKQLAGEAADEAEISLSEFMVRCAAKELKRPDLAEVPRKKMGRPRKEMALNGK